MKFIHLSDLHIGKRVNEFSMLEDQEYILTKILNIADDEKPDAVFICGDIYDKSVPSSEAITLFDSFLVKLSSKGLKIFIISGNHDSPERMSFGAKLLTKSDVFISPVYKKNIDPVTVRDEFGIINVYMLPFIKPINVRIVFPENTINTYTDAVECVIKNLQLDTDERNILLTHQFVTGAERSESEDISVGGSDNVSATIFEDFDYVALGHIHKPQSITRETIRYCGTPLKYSFSEANHKKSVTIVELLEKNSIEIKTVDLIPKRDMVEIKGLYMDLTNKSYYDKLSIDDYYHITLTDEDNIPDAMNKLRVIYKNIMKLDYHNKRTMSNSIVDGVAEVEAKSPLNLISEFYQLQNNQEISTEQGNFLEDLIENIWEDEK